MPHRRPHHPGTITQTTILRPGRSRRLWSPDQAGKLNILPLLSLLNCEWHNKRTGVTAECRAARATSKDAHWTVVQSLKQQNSTS